MRRIRLQRPGATIYSPTSRKRSYPQVLALVLLVSLCYTTWMLYFSSSITNSSTTSPSVSILHEATQPRHRTRIPPSLRAVVDRNTLFDLIVDGQEEEIAFAPDVVNVRWPPIVTAIPEVHPSPEVTRIDLTTTSVDSQFCPGHPRCRFLLPLWIGEQESKGQVHLTQILHLAVSLNRTVVLPNVGKSRLGACGRWKLGAYYDVGSVARQLKDIGGPHAQMSLLDDFKTWVSMRPEGPVGQVVFLNERPATTLSASSQSQLVLSEGGLDLLVDKNYLDMDDSRLKNAYCLKTKFGNLRLESRRPVTVHANISDATPLSSAGNALSATLRRGGPLTTQQTPDDVDVAGTSPPQDAYGLDEDLPAAITSPSEPDVLVLHWDLRHLPFATPHDVHGLEYSERLRDFINMLTTPSQPYLVVHWKMETTQVSVLSDCAEALVDTLSILLADPTLAKNIKTVWLATDISHTKTSQVCTKECEEALAIVRAAFELGGPLEDWTLTSLEEEVKRVRSEIAANDEEFSLDDEDDDNHLWEDSGILEILDKMVAMQSALFVTGTRGCGKPRLVPSANSQ